MDEHQFTTRLTFISDPGHGWLVVPLQDIARLGVQDEISNCSFISVHGGMAFLEEDCDVAVYFNRLLAEKSIELTATDSWTDHFNRSAPRFGDAQFNEAFWQKAREGAFNN